MKLLLADDHGLFRDSMAMWLQQLDANVETVFASDFDSVKHALTKNQFDLVILDLYMPQMQGVVSIKSLCSEYPSLPIVVVSAEENKKIIQSCIDAGAKGYVPKSADGKTILNAIQKVIHGQLYLPDSITLTANRTDTLAVAFNEKQNKILALIAEGKSNREIADTMFLSEGTIKQYVTKILRLLNVDNRVQASAKAAEILGIQRH